MLGGDFPAGWKWNSATYAYRASVRIKADYFAAAGKADVVERRAFPDAVAGRRKRNTQDGSNNRVRFQKLVSFIYAHY
jgi:hypothetical protein